VKEIRIKAYFVERDEVPLWLLSDGELVWAWFNFFHHQYSSFLGDKYIVLYGSMEKFFFLFCLDFLVQEEY
jgi:hypothetical protein